MRSPGVFLCSTVFFFSSDVTWFVDVLKSMIRLLSRRHKTRMSFLCLRTVFTLFYDLNSFHPPDEVPKQCNTIIVTFFKLKENLTRTEVEIILYLGYVRKVIKKGFYTLLRFPILLHIMIGLTLILRSFTLEIIIKCTEKIISKDCMSFWKLVLIWVIRFRY